MRGNLLLRITVPQTGLGDCPVPFLFRLTFGEERIKRGANGKTLDAGNLCKSGFVFQIGQKFFQKRRSAEKTLARKLFPGRFFIRSRQNESLVALSRRCPAATELRKDPVRKQKFRLPAKPGRGFEAGPWIFFGMPDHPGSNRV